jgi:hypothetical protein
MGIKVEVVQPKGIGNIFNKIIAENFPNIEKVTHPEHLDHQREMTKIENLHGIL